MIKEVAYYCGIFLIIISLIVIFSSCGKETVTGPDEECEIIFVDEEKHIICGGSGYDPKQEHKPR